MMPMMLAVYGDHNMLGLPFIDGLRDDEESRVMAE